MSVNQGNFTSVNNILTTPNTVFIIPIFQRPYAWEANHLQDLFNDLDMASKRDHRYRHHYLSPIHIVKINSPDNEYWKTYVDQGNDDIRALNEKASKSGYYDDNQNQLKIYLIIDGQQRLTTLFGLFYTKHKKTLSSYLFLDVDGIKIPKLILNPADDHYKFKKLLGLETSPPGCQSRAQKRLEKCFEHAISINEASSKFLKSPGLQMLVVELDPPYGLQAFQTQNDRGKLLTNLERVKSLFMEYDLNYCESSLAKDINQVFGELYRVLDKSIEVGIFRKGESGDDDLLQLISTYLRIMEEPDVYWHGGEKIYKEYFKEELKKSGDKKLLLNEWLSSIPELIKQLDYLNDCVSKKDPTSSVIVSSRTEGDDYNIILNSLKLSSRTLALLLKFRVQFGIEWHKRVEVSNIIFDSLNIIRELQDKLNNIKGRIDRLPEKSTLIDKINKLEKRIKELEERKIDEISPLELIEKIELVVLKLWNPKGNFATCWRNVFNCSNPTIEDAVTTWYNWFWHTKSFIHEILYGSGNEAVYQYILREYESYYFKNLIHFNNNLQFEHIFPLNPKKSFTPYGFLSEKEYQNFIGKIENRNFLDAGLNKLISNDFPDQKADSYVTQSYPTIREEYKVPTGNQVKSTIQIGEDFQLIGTKYLLYQLYLELRNVELAVFTIERFF